MAVSVRASIKRDVVGSSLTVGKNSARFLCVPHSLISDYKWNQAQSLCWNCMYFLFNISFKSDVSFADEYRVILKSINHSIRDFYEDVYTIFK